MYPHDIPKLMALLHDRDRENLMLRYQLDQYQEENRAFKHLPFFDVETGDVISIEDFRQRC
jgi:hypothetical protein